MPNELAPTMLAAEPHSGDPAPFSFSTELFSPEVIEQLTADEAKGIYTAERCPKDKRNAIIQLRGSGRSKNSVIRTLGVHRLTIIAIEEKFPEEIDAVRKRTARQMRRCLGDQLDRLEENPGILPPSAIPMAVNVLNTNAQLLEGQATARVEHSERVDIYADWDSFVEKQLQPSIDVIELPSETGLGGEKRSPLKDEVSEEVRQLESWTDGESEHPTSVTEVNGQPATTLSSDRTPRTDESERLETAPRGGLTVAEGQNASTHKSEQKISAIRGDES
jgi:hypothetical protein